MKSIHILIIVIIYLLYVKSKKTAPLTNMPILIDNALLRRDYQEQLDLLKEEIEELKGPLV